MKTNAVILVVDDHAAVLESMTVTLEAEGYQVLAADGAAQFREDAWERPATGSTLAGSGRTRVLREGARAAGLKVYGGENAPYLWVRMPEGVTSWQAFDRILGEAHVVITPGSGFGAKGEGYCRISSFNSRANAEEVARRLQQLKW